MGELHLGRYCVDGKMPDDSHQGDGEEPPFLVFDTQTQTWLWESFATRAEAEFFMRSLTE